MHKLTDENVSTSSLFLNSRLMKFQSESSRSMLKVHASTVLSVIMFPSEIPFGKVAKMELFVCFDSCDQNKQTWQNEHCV